jgi:hypothetical protein
MLTLLHRFVKTYDRASCGVSAQHATHPIEDSELEPARRDSSPTFIGDAIAAEAAHGKGRTWGAEFAASLQGSNEDLPALRCQVREETERMLSRSGSSNLLARGTSQSSLTSLGSDCSDVCNFYRLLDVDPEMRMAYVK